MKKAVSISLLIALMMSNIGCASETNSTVGGDNLTSSDDTSASVETDIYAGLPERDLDGTEIKIFGYGAAGYNYVDSEAFEAEETGEPVDDAIYRRNRETESRLGVTLTFDTSFAERDSVATFNRSILAGDDLCDLYVMKAIYAGQVITSGTVMPWNDIKGYDLENPWYVKDANEQIKIGDSQYGILSDACSTNITMCWTWVFNKRLVSEWKLDDPYEVVRSGKWTMDKAYSMTKDVYTDLNGNSTADADDLYGFYTDSYATLDAFMVSHGIKSIGRDSDNYPTVDFYSEKLVKSFEKIYDLYWNNSGAYVDTNAPYDYRVNFANGQAVFSPMLLNYLIGTDLRSMDDDYGLIPYPKLDEDQSEYKTHMLGRTGVFFLPINISEEKADVVGEVVEVMSAYSYKYLRPAIYDLSLTEKGVRDDDSLEMLELIMDSRTYDFSMFLEVTRDYAFSPMLAYRENIAAKNINITSYYESKKTSATEYLETVVEAVKELE